NNQRTTRQGEWWRHEETVDNSDDPVFAAVNIVGVKNNVGTSGEDAVSEASGAVYVAETPEIFTYDYDGNLTSDGRWTYTWDAENRLIAMESISTVPTAAKKKLEFEYDYRWRRISKKVYEWNAGTSGYDLAESRG